MQANQLVPSHSSRARRSAFVTQRVRLIDAHGEGYTAGPQGLRYAGGSRLVLNEETCERLAELGFRRKQSPLSSLVLLVDEAGKFLLRDSPSNPGGAELVMSLDVERPQLRSIAHEVRNIAAATSLRVMGEGRFLDDAMTIEGALLESESWACVRGIRAGVHLYEGLASLEALAWGQDALVLFDASWSVPSHKAVGQMVAASGRLDERDWTRLYVFDWDVVHSIAVGRYSPPVEFAGRGELVWLRGGKVHAWARGTDVVQRERLLREFWPAC